MARHYRHLKKSAGVTLVELLVVVTIAVVLLAASIPMMQPVIKGREVREAAREVQAFIKAAEVRAMERGRPVGVAFLRSETNPNLVYQLALAEVPPPYMGDTTNARALVTLTNGGNWVANLDPPPSSPKLIAAGDRIRFDFRGPTYRVAGPPSGPKLGFHLDGSVPPPKGQLGVTKGVPFQIFRRPRITAAAPLELPVPAAIDLIASGLGTVPLPPSSNHSPNTGIGQEFMLPSDETFQDQISKGNIKADEVAAIKQQPVIFMFAPSGGIDRVHYTFTGFDPPLPGPNSEIRPEFRASRIIDPLFLLLGRAEQMGDANISDGNSQWISVTHSGTMHFLPNNPQAYTSASVSGFQIPEYLDELIRTKLFYVRRDVREKWKTASSN